MCEAQKLNEKLLMTLMLKKKLQSTKLNVLNENPLMVKKKCEAQNLMNLNALMVKKIQREIKNRHIPVALAITSVKLSANSA
jgi:hypothetical protein